ncbi:MAG: GNAT family N-acetyltransferase [Desulfosarcinaceae bacterium]|nr:GNAT family N-acetyltransferase [Desulfosarcinaceae bacterium]
MPRLHITAYTEALRGRQVVIACREGILRDHLAAVLADLKFLQRQGIATTLVHNMANRFANQQHFKRFAERLPATAIERVPVDTDFYAHVLDHHTAAHKLIFLERKALCDATGRRINTLSTATAQAAVSSYGDLITNANFKGIIHRICQRIDGGDYDRVHILPASKHAIKHELFTIEGSGTLIANNFKERFDPVHGPADIDMVLGILGLYKRKGYIKARSRSYVAARKENFFITRIDGIVVGCAEALAVDTETVELGALAISTKFRNQRVGVFTVEAFVAAMEARGYRRLISLTNNPRLAALYDRMGFTPTRDPAFADRQAQSPGVQMYLYRLR